MCANSNEELDILVLSIRDVANLMDVYFPSEHYCWKLLFCCLHACCHVYHVLVSTVCKF